MTKVRCFFKKIRHRLIKPQKGEVYLGDTFDFLVGKTVEQILHGLRDNAGNLQFVYWEGKNNYRLTISSVQPTYFICTAEVLVKDASGKFQWKKRSQQRRILEAEFKDMILDGRIKKLP